MEGSKTTKTAEDLIVIGLYCYKNFRVRDQFYETLNTMVTKTSYVGKRGPGEGKTILSYMLSILRRNFPAEEYYYLNRECKQFFALFSTVIDEHFRLKLVGTHEMEGLLQTAIEKLKIHETKEKQSSVFEDKTLIGYLHLIEKMLSHYEEMD